MEIRKIQLKNEIVFSIFQLSKRESSIRPRSASVASGGLDLALSFGKTSSHFRSSESQVFSLLRRCWQSMCTWLSAVCGSRQEARRAGCGRGSVTPRGTNRQLMEMWDNWKSTSANRLSSQTRKQHGDARVLVKEKLCV